MKIITITDNWFIYKSAFDSLTVGKTYNVDDLVQHKEKPVRKEAAAHGYGLALWWKLECS